MARPITLKYVVSFSSQDDAYSVQNLLKDRGFKKWLSHPKDRSGSLEAVFQLETSCILSYLDIGTYWCSNISIEVGKSEWPQSRPFEPLIRNACLMTHARAFNSLCHSTHLYGRRLVMEWAEVEQNIDELRKKTAEHFHNEIPRKKAKKADILTDLQEAE